MHLLVRLQNPPRHGLLHRVKKGGGARRIGCGGGRGDLGTCDIGSQNPAPHQSHRRGRKEQQRVHSIVGLFASGSGQGAPWIKADILLAGRPSRVVW